MPPGVGSSQPSHFSINSSFSLPTLTDSQVLPFWSVEWRLRAVHALVGFCFFLNRVLQGSATSPCWMPRAKQLVEIVCCVSVVPVACAYLCHMLFPYYCYSKILFLQSSVINHYISEQLICFYLVSPVHFIIPSLQWLIGGSESSLQITSRKM